MSIVFDKNNNKITVFSTKNEEHIGALYALFKECFHPSELEPKEAMIKKALGKQKCNTEFLIYVAFKEGKLVGGYTCLVINNKKQGNISYVEYIVINPSERRNHIATAILQGGVMQEYDADVLIDIVDPNKLKGATKEEIDYVSSKSKFWSNQGARKLELKNFQQPDFEDEQNIDEGSFLAYIPKDPITTEISSKKLASVLQIINKVSNGVENAEEQLPKMFNELKQSKTIAISQIPLALEVLQNDDLLQ